MIFWERCEQYCFSSIVSLILIIRSSILEKNWDSFFYTASFLDYYFAINIPWKICIPISVWADMKWRKNVHIVPIKINKTLEELFLVSILKNSSFLLFQCPHSIIWDFFLVAIFWSVFFRKLFSWIIIFVNIFFFVNFSLYSKKIALPATI